MSIELMNATLMNATRTAAAGKKQIKAGQTISLRQVTRIYDGQTVLDRLDLDLPLQGIVCLTGPSGSGKTTLMRLVAGFEQPDSGEITGNDGLVFSTLFQEDRLLPWLTAAENLEQVLHQPVAGLWLEKVGLSDAFGKYPGELSGGMRRRVALARALAFPSDVLFLDEPFKGLDGSLREEMMALVRQARGSRPVFLITHDEYEVRSLAGIVLRFAGPPLRLIEAGETVS